MAGAALLGCNDINLAALAEHRMARARLIAPAGGRHGHGGVGGRSSSMARSMPAAPGLAWRPARERRHRRAAVPVRQPGLLSVEADAARS